MCSANLLDSELKIIEQNSLIAFTVMNINLITMRTGYPLYFHIIPVKDYTVIKLEEYDHVDV